MKKIFVCVVAVICTLVFVGCKPSAERRFRVYEDGEKYTAGEFVCDGGAVKRIEIDWVGGNVEIEQTPQNKVSVFEDDYELLEEKRLHTYLSDGVLRIKYCRSGCLGKIDEQQKNLQVDIPKGVDVKINTVRANVYLGVLETGDLEIRTDTGCIEGENILCKGAKIQTSSGYIGVGLLAADDIQIFSVSGDIHLGAPSGFNSKIKTADGDVTLYLWGDVYALIDFTTQSGQLKTERKYVCEENKYLFLAEGEELRKISVETGSGHLRIE